MQQLPTTTLTTQNVGYVVDRDKKKEEYYKNESHIHKQGPLTGAKVVAHKLTNDVFTYFPKGFAGSKNSDFYEYLSMSMIPNIVGSAMLIYTAKGANKFFNAADKAGANKGAKMMGAGVVLYAIGSWLHNKISNAGLKATTGIPLEQKYLNKCAELPEPGKEKGLVRTQYPGVYDSVQFYRSDLLVRDAEINHGNRYYYDDKVAAKSGYSDKENASNQIAGEKVRGVKSRATALQNIGKYIVAATGVALGSQKAFSNMNIRSLKSIKESFIEGAKQLWNGTNYNFATKHFGKALVGLSAIMTLLSIVVPTIGFKSNPETMKSKVDTNKEFEVC